MAFLDFLGGNVIEQVGKVADSLITSDEERMEKANEIAKAKLMAEANEDEQITKRWKSDNEHAITRLVRPFLVGYSVFMFTAVLLADGNVGEFHIREAYIPLIEGLLFTTVGGYFALRTFDKHSKRRNDKSNSED